jgi:hypothetical protein
MTTTNTQFESKEHYLAFRKAWATAVNSDKAKSRCVTKKVRANVDHSITDETYTTRISGWIDASHHVLYNLLRDKPFHRGFTIISNRTILTNGMSPAGKLYEATCDLNRIRVFIEDEAKHPVYLNIKKWLVLVTKTENKPYWGTSHIDEFLAPFDGTVTRDMILNMDLPERETLRKALYTSFGKMRYVVAKMLTGEVKLNNYDDLVIALKEVA